MARKTARRHGRKIKYWGHRTIDPEQSERLEQVLDKLVDVVDDIKDLVTDIGKKVDINVNLSEVSEEKLTEVVSDLDEAIECVDDAFGLIENIREGE